MSFFDIGRIKVLGGQYTIFKTLLFLNFFKNHGLFKLKNRPQWFTVANRSKTYVNKILSKISGEYFKNYEINKIIRSNNGVQIYYGSESEFFNYDKVVLASHADESLKIISDSTIQEKEILSNFKYKPNKAIIHSDESAMPKNKKAWCSWNSSLNPQNNEQSSVTYWLNQLQNLKIDQNIFLTINPFFKIDQSKIFDEIDFNKANRFLLDISKGKNHKYKLAEPSKESGESVLEALDLALTLAKEKKIDAINFAPMNKTSLKLGGNTHSDELQLMAEKLDVKSFC